MVITLSNYYTCPTLSQQRGKIKSKPSDTFPNLENYLMTLYIAIFLIPFIFSRGPSLLIRSILFKTLFYGLITLLLILLMLCLPFPGRKFIMGAIDEWSRFTRWMMKVIVGIEVVYTGLENFPDHLPYIVSPKHDSTMDPFIAVGIIHDVTAIGKRELFLTPFLGQVLWKMGIIPVTRNKGTGHKRLPNIKEYLERDPRPLLIYPEGTRVLLESKVPLKSGAYHVQVETGLPVIPIATNAAIFWPHKKLLMRPGKVIYEVGEPIEPGLSRDDFMEQIQIKIINRSKELREMTPNYNP
jgi:1-acyl-sn-glycerol-3-phosphate acyltransferase